MAELHEDNRLLQIKADSNEDKRFIKTEDNYIIKQVIDGQTISSLDVV